MGLKEAQKTQLLQMEHHKQELVEAGVQKERDMVET